MVACRGGGIGDLQGITLSAVGDYAAHRCHGDAEHLVVITIQLHRQRVCQATALDVDGICGGYNMAFAFITGYLSGQDK